MPQLAFARIFGLFFFLTATTPLFGQTDYSFEAKPDSTITGVVLSGGGALGFAHIGVLKYLEELGVPVDRIGGTSMGGIVGGLYATGYSASDLSELVKAQDWDFLLSNQFNRELATLDARDKQDRFLISLKSNADNSGVNLGSSLVNGINIYLLLKEFIYEKNPKNRFEDQKIPFYCVAVDLESREEIIQDSGMLAEALLATMAVPAFFNPLQNNGSVLVDGGVLNNFPVNEMRKRGAQRVLGVRLQSLEEELIPNDLFSILSRTFSLLMSIVREQNEGEPDIKIAIPLQDYSFFDFDKAEELIEIGYQAAKAQKNDLLPWVRKKTTGKQDAANTSPSADSLIFLANIEIQGNGKLKTEKILTYLKLSKGIKYTFSQIKEGIKKLQASDQFDQILFYLDGPTNEKTLRIDVKEKTDALFNIGLRYDSDFGPSILLNPQIKDFLGKGSIFELTARLNNNPYFLVNYQLNSRGSVIPFLKIYLGGEDYYTYLNSRDINVDQLNLFETTLGMQWNAAVSVRARLGVSAQWFGFTNHYRQFLFDEIDKNLYLSFIELEKENLDRTAFPTRGIHLKALTQWIYHPIQPDNSNQTGSRISLSFRHYLPISPTWTLASGFQFGSSNQLSDRQFSFFVGGMDSHLRVNSFFQAGIPLMKYSGSHALAFRSHLRKTFGDAHQVLAGFSIAGLSNSMNDLLDNNYFQGVYAGYGYNSSQGPLEIYFSTATRQLDFEILIRAGYVF